MNTKSGTQSTLTNRSLYQSPNPQSEPLAPAAGELEQLLRTHQMPASTSKPLHTLAEVTEVLEDEAGVARAYSVKVEGLQYLCEKAASCLLIPSPGDSVLISGPDSEHLYIIAIIKQAQPEKAELQFQGHLTLRSQQLSLQGTEAMKLQSAHVEMEAQTAQCVIDRADYVGKELRSTISITRLVGKVYEVIVDRLSQMSRSTFRITEQVEQVRAGTMDYQAEDSARIHSKYTMVTGKDLVKVDSDQIHMG
ncbi:DUF3540 domain-containing protein [Oligella urethralis]|uniref:DUF3540 domain-containing protein n=1 Tax=Oligella urethralis TaxID=90245 RepID=UPI00254D70B2|nr:DUF3540 domain-containing protein [Oligella urethralis]MDK6202644.1 DUF3540 domain-containing protein [Oligella urethralis]